MKDLIHRATLLGLVVIIMMLLWKLLSQNSVANATVIPDEPRDLFDMANYEKRKQEFSRDNERETRLGMRAK